MPFTPPHASVRLRLRLLVWWPYQSALQNVADNGLEDKIEVRILRFSCFEPVRRHFRITIAGMGGCRSDIQPHWEISQFSPVLQPNNQRTAGLAVNPICIVDSWLEENEKFKEILCGRRFWWSWQPRNCVLSYLMVCLQPTAVQEVRITLLGVPARINLLWYR